MIRLLHVPGCNTNEAKREVTGRPFERRKIDVLALSETKIREKGERSRVVRHRVREGVTLLVIPEVQQGCEQMERYVPKTDVSESEVFTGDVGVHKCIWV